MRVALLIFLSLCSSIFVAAQSGEWKQLFDGKDLVGWKHVGPGSMTVEDGLIRTHGGMGLLYWTGGKLGDCVIRVVYKMRDHNSNSGVFIRIPLEPREEWIQGHRRGRSTERAACNRRRRWRTGGRIRPLRQRIAGCAGATGQERANRHQ